MKNRILAFFILLMLSFSFFAEENSFIRFDPGKTEWFAFALG